MNEYGCRKCRKRSYIITCTYILSLLNHCWHIKIMLGFQRPRLSVSHKFNTIDWRASSAYFLSVIKPAIIILYPNNFEDLVPVYTYLNNGKEFVKNQAYIQVILMNIYFSDACFTRQNLHHTRSYKTRDGGS